MSGHNGDIHRINAGGSDSDDTDAPNSRGTSTITVMEIGA
jgi:hypothetical protein